MITEEPKQTRKKQKLQVFSKIINNPNSTDSNQNDARSQKPLETSKPIATTYDFKDDTDFL